MTPKFTLDAGLRWDYAQPLRDRYGMGTFDWTTGKYYWDMTNPVTHQPANIRPGGVAPDYNGYQPRLGIAYAIDPKTVVRSSFGIFDDTFSITAQSESSAWGNWPFAFPQSESSMNPGKPTLFIQNPFPGPAVGSTTPLGCNQCFNVDRNTTRTPYVEEWSFSIQRQLAPSLMAQVAYFGSHGVKQTGQIVDNTALEPGTTPLASRQRWPQFPPFILNYYNGFSSWYDGLSGELKKQMSHNLLFNVSYTWGHALDETDSLSGGNGLGAPNSNPTRFQVNNFKGPAGFDLRQIFSTAYTYKIPWGPQNYLLKAALGNWQLSGIVSADSGAPFWVVLAHDNENIGYVGRNNEFPNITCDPQKNAPRTRQEWFNTSCYQIPAYGTAGDGSRKGLTSQGLFNWDQSVSKSWPLLGDRSIQLRADAFNLPNNHTFDAPNAYDGSPSFGEITCCKVRQPGRVVQLVGKIYF
jgi:hypothetical protein